MAFQLTKLKNERNETSSTSKQPFKVIKRRQSTRRPFAGYSTDSELPKSSATERGLGTSSLFCTV